MIKFVLSCLQNTLVIIAVSFSISSMASNCSENLIGSKPNRKTLGIGFVLRLKSKLKKILVFENGHQGTEPASHISAYWPDVPLHNKNIFELVSNQQLRTLSPVLKEGDGPYRIRVEILPAGQQAVMYWVDVFNNTVVEQAGEIKPQNPAAARYKFPNKRDRHRRDELWAQGQTAWGRPRAELGQKIWIANHSRTMGQGSVGILKAIDPSAFATVTTLDGKNKPADHWDCVPLTDEEIGWFK